RLEVSCERGSGKFGNRAQHPATIPESDAELLQIPVLDIPKDRKVGYPVFGKAIRVLGPPERSELLSNRRHCSPSLLDTLTHGAAEMPNNPEVPCTSHYTSLRTR